MKLSFCNRARKGRNRMEDILQKTNKTTCWYLWEVGERRKKWHNQHNQCQHSRQKQSGVIYCDCCGVMMAVLPVMRSSAFQHSSVRQTNQGDTWVRCWGRENNWFLTTRWRSRAGKSIEKSKWESTDATCYTKKLTMGPLQRQKLFYHLHGLYYAQVFCCA